MKHANPSVLALVLFSLCLFASCRTTEEQLRSISPELLRGNAYNAQTFQSTPQQIPAHRKKALWLLLIIVIAGTFILFSAGSKPERKPASKTTPSRRKRAVPQKRKK